jgi:hypothetical protein
MLKIVLAILLLGQILQFFGCTSFKEHTKNLGENIAEGTRNTYEAIKKADVWFKENWW